MEYRIPKKGEIYRHFKGNLYEVIVIARDSETLEEKVVYKEVNGEAVYVRSLPMFVSFVDKEKYPDVTQEFRFELVPKAAPQEMKQNTVNVDVEPEIQDKGYSMIMQYLELDSVEDKMEYLLRAKDCITEEFISVVAQSLDFVESEDALPDRYDAILRYLRTVAKYESKRLR